MSNLCVCFKDFEGGEVNLGVDYYIFTKISFCIHFITIYKIKYYINLFIIYNFKNI